MGPQKVLVPVPFAGGLDTKTDPKQVLPGKLLALENGVFQQTGALSRRWGYEALGKTVLGASAPIAACQAVRAFEEELLLFDGAAAYSYLPSSDSWASRGALVGVAQSNTPIIRNTSQQLSPDFGSLGGVDLYAWEDSRGGIRYSVLDSEAGTLEVIDQPLYAGMASSLERPKVMAFAGVLLVFFGNASGQLSYVAIAPGAPARAATFGNIVLNGLATPVFFDACVAGSTLYLAYYTAGAVMLAAMTTGLAIPWTATVATQASVPTGALNVTADASGNAWVTYADNGTGSETCSTAVYSSAGTQLLAPVQVVSQATGALAAVAALVNGATATVYAEAKGAQTYFEVVYQNTLTLAGALGAAAASAPVFARGVGLASKPFSYGGNAYVNVAFESPLQSTYFTLSASGQVVSKVNAGVGGGLIAESDAMLPECPQVASGVFRYPNLVKGLPNTEAGAILTLLGVNGTTLDFAPPSPFASASINGGFYTVGGIVSRYDGAAYVECGFHVYPEGITSSSSSSGGALGTGTYDYAVTYEWSDNTGAVEISTPSVVLSVTFGGGSTNSVTLTIPTLKLTRKGKVKVVVYRTAANGTLLNRVTSAILPLYSDPTTDTVTLVDTLSDASIAANGLLYTQPLTTGSNPVLENVAPPACSLLATFDDRIFIAGLDDPNAVAYTQPTLANTPMQFCAELTMRTDPEGGAVTALARMDDKLVVFKESAIFYFNGTGPTPTGDASGYSPLVSIPSGGVGCVAAATVVLSPLGLLFQSADGIYLLDRSLNVTYKGAPAEAFNALVLTSGTLVPNQWIVWTSEGGTALCYDYYYDQWSTFSNHPAVGSALYLGGDNTLVWANAAGSVFEQTVDGFSDAGSPIAFSLTTAWLNPGQIQGYQRVFHGFLLGTYKGSHTLNVWCGFDYDDALTAMTTIAVDGVLGVSVFGGASPFGSDSPYGGALPGQAVYQFRLDILRKCQAIRFQISDLQAAPGNEGFSLSALSLVLGVKPGGFRLPKTKQFGVV